MRDEARPLSRKKQGESRALLVLGCFISFVYAFGENSFIAHLVLSPKRLAFSGTSCSATMFLTDGVQKLTDSKDERHRATVRWTVATASDQAPAGARIESCLGRQEKSTSSEVLFSMKRTLRCMKNEVELRPMKRGFAARRGVGAYLHARISWKAKKDEQLKSEKKDAIIYENNLKEANLYGQVPDY